jgi:hypothetical protein
MAMCWNFNLSILCFRWVVSFAFFACVHNCLCDLWNVLCKVFKMFTQTSFYNLERLNEQSSKNPGEKNLVFGVGNLRKWDENFNKAVRRKAPMPSQAKYNLKFIQGFNSTNMRVGCVTVPIFNVVVNVGEKSANF